MHSLVCPSHQSIAVEPLEPVGLPLLLVAQRLHRWVTNWLMKIDCAVVLFKSLIPMLQAASSLTLTFFAALYFDLRICIFVGSWSMTYIASPFPQLLGYVHH